MCTSVFAAGFLVVLAVAAVVRFEAFSPPSSSECSVLASDWSELWWDDISSERDVEAIERAVNLNFLKNVIRTGYMLLLLPWIYF